MVDTGRQDTSPQDARTLERRLARAEQRLEALERLVLQCWCAIVGTLLLIGILVPWGYSVEDGEDVAWSVLTAAVRLADENNEVSGSDTGFNVLATIGFIGLIVVVVAMMGTLIAIAGQDRGTGFTRFVRVLRVLGLIGTGVVLLFSAMFAGTDEIDAAGGPGGLLLLAGMIGYVTLSTESARARWVASAQSLERRGS